MIPFIHSEVFYLGPIPFRTWGTFVAVGFGVATYIAARRAVQKSLSPTIVWDIAAWMFVAGFVGARLFHVIFYDPVFYLANPLAIIDPRQPGFAIYGGFLACAGVFWWYTKRKGLDAIAYADTLIWGIPWGCGIGRIGCFLIHDHPGTLSSSLFAVKYPDGNSRHDLGLYLSIAGFVMGLLFLFLNRRSRGPGFWIGAFLILDGVSRIWLDFYRIVDARYLWLTPTQWITIPLIILGAWFVRRSMLQSPNIH